MILIVIFVRELLSCAGFGMLMLKIYLAVKIYFLPILIQEGVAASEYELMNIIRETFPPSIFQVG